MQWVRQSRRQAAYARASQVTRVRSNLQREAPFKVNEPICPECGQTIEAGLEYGLCADCLLKAGQGGSDPYAPTFDSQAPSGPMTAPSLDELNGKVPNIEILELLGQGGMGAVYKARQTSLDRIVALKVINKEVLSNQNLVDRFSLEAKALARLNHPHIVSVYDFGNVEGMCYLVMEFVDGTDLRQLIASNEISPQHALQIVPQVCEALQFAHDQGIVHRDIKPENILIDRDGKIKIADFGLAKLLTEADGPSNLTTTQQVMGTLKYMAPEQMEGASLIDHRADIYSLGVVFYELLTGEVPLGRFGAPSERAPTDKPIDHRLDEIVLRALERHLPDRYQQISDLQVAVEHVSSSEMQPQLEPLEAQPVMEAQILGEEGYPTQPHTNSNANTNAASAMSPEQLKTHVRIIAGINIAFGLLFFVLGGFVFLLLGGIGIASDEAEALGVLSTVGGLSLLVMFLLGLPSFIVGWGLWKFRWWARYGALVLAALNILNFPVGTAISVYTGWALLQNGSEELFKAGNTNPEYGNTGAV